MRSILRLALLGTIAACRSDSAAGPSSSQTPINHGVIISADAPSAHQQETTLAQSATGRIVVAWIGWIKTGSAVSTIEYTISDDRGSTWSRPQQLAIPGEVLAMSDPALAVDGAGTFTLAALGDGPNMAVYAFRLPAGASAFGAPITVARGSQAAGTSFDKTWIVATASGLLVTYNFFHGTDSLGLASTSRDAATWKVDTMPMHRPMFVNPCADGDGVSTVYMATGGTVSSVSSADGGLTWAPAVTVGTGAPIAAGFGVTVPSCVRHGNNLWVLVPRQGFTIMQSTDGGASFTTRGTLTTASSQAQLGVSADGTIDVVYYDERSTYVASLMHTRLAPGTSQFSAPDAIRAGLHVGLSSYGVDGFADYVGIIPGAGTFTDNANGTSHIAFFRLPPA